MYASLNRMTNLIVAHRFETGCPVSGKAEGVGAADQPKNAHIYNVRDAFDGARGLQALLP